ncbi:uncharacterized protein G2W53_008359 [Senna tora]|uniref:Uncharacterized protein n=1 Tax=Senna tora TaxID=362788 RepID=A0A834X8J4_9FABA|nr:uncharacterized protein G2W53_008359 [Senna tora]
MDSDYYYYGGTGTQQQDGSQKATQKGNETTHAQVNDNNDSRNRHNGI